MGPSHILSSSPMDDDRRLSSGSTISSSSTSDSSKGPSTSSAPSSCPDDPHEASPLSAIGSGQVLTPTSTSWTVRIRPGERRKDGRSPAPVGQDLRELEDEDLERLGTESLVRLLRSEWVAQDKQDSKEEEERDAQIAQIINHHINTEEELEKENTRMEDELAEKISLVRRLQGRIVELEKDKREKERQFLDQTASFEAERAALYDNENHLKTRLLSLARRQASPSPMHSQPMAQPVTDDQDPTELLHRALERTTKLEKELKVEAGEKEALRKELQMLEAGHVSLQEALERTGRELREVKRSNLDLQEEIESYSLLLVERTISGRMSNTGILSGQTFPNDLRPSSTFPNPAPGSLDDLPQMRPTFHHAHSASSLHSVEEEEETLDPALFSPDSGWDSKSNPHSTLADLDLDPSFGSLNEEETLTLEPTERTIRERKKSARVTVDQVLKESGALPRESSKESLAQYGVTGSGLDLAAELGRAEVDVEEGGMRKLEKGDEGEFLRSEIKSLRDANRALTLYTSKILDRILSMDGYEDILSADKGNSLQDSVRRITAKKSRQNLRELSAHIASQHSQDTASPPPSLSTPPIMLSNRPGHRTSKSVSAISTNFLTTFSSSPSTKPRPSEPTRLSPTSATSPLPRTSDTTTPAVKPKRSSRPASIDWKGGFASFFSPSSSPVVPPLPASTESRLRPLHLSTSPAFAGTVSPPRPTVQRAFTFSSASSFGTSGRETVEVEDEEDRLHRERVQLIQQQLAADDQGYSRSGRQRRSSSVGLASKGGSPSPSTPGSRPAPVESMVEHFEGASYFPQLSSSPGTEAFEVTEELVAARLRNFDAEERLKAAEIATSSGGLSAPFRRASIGVGRHRSPSSSAEGSPEQEQWLRGSKKTTVIDETLFEYND